MMRGVEGSDYINANFIDVSSWVQYRQSVLFYIGKVYSV